MQLVRDLLDAAQQQQSKSNNDGVERDATKINVI
jgi:hypothetical protein